MAEAWIRAPGATPARPSHLKSRTVVLDTAALVNVARFDAQYGTRQRYRGVPLESLLDSRASFGCDFAVPVPLHTYRAPHSLFLHAKYREMNATHVG